MMKDESLAKRSLVDAEKPEIVMP